MARGGRRRPGRPRARSRRSGLVAGLLLAVLAVLAGSVSACAAGDPVGDGAAADTIAPTTTPARTPSTTVPAPPSTLAPGDPAGARLRVTQDLTSCCYPSGHVSWLLVTDQAGAEVLRRTMRPPADPVPLVDGMLPAGAYHVVSAQQVCSGTCATPGDAVDRCDADIELAAGSTTYLTVGVDPGAGCAIVLAAGPLASPIVDELALPGAALDCGYDASLAAAASTGGDVVLSDARRCLSAAAQRGDAAWLQADEPVDGTGAVGLVSYRLAADGSVVVYQVADPTAAVWGWVRSRCGHVVADDVRGFLVQRCSVPEAVPWVAT